MMLATDFITIRDSLYGGKGEINTYPLAYIREYKDAYLPLEDAPEEVQELYIYNQEKAKQLLTDAGYPDGFHANITCYNDPALVDYLSVVKDMWSRVNINIDIFPEERGAFNSIIYGRKQQELIYTVPGPTGVNVYTLANLTGFSSTNASFIEDPYAWQVKEEVGLYSMTDPHKADLIHKEFMKYALAQVWAIPSVLPPNYTFWCPWVKKYHGESTPGYLNNYHYTKFVWIDQDLKKSMGY
jgi:ABC-type transport system substrate-binding protein